MKSYSSLFMDIAERTATDSNCVKYKVGSVVVMDNRIVLQGFNGTVSGFLNCSEKFKGVDMSIQENRDLHHKWSSAFEVHAEMNIISYAARKGISLENTIMYCTHSPCNNCLKHLISSGVKKVIYKTEYFENSNLSEREELLKHIEIEQY